MTEIIKFWLIDINYQESERGDEIRLWGIDDKNRRVLLLEENFKPFFYVKAKSPEALDILFNRLSTSAGPLKPVIEVKKVRRKLFGKNIAVLEVKCRSEKDMERTVEKLIESGLVDETFEDDLRVTDLYIIDTDLTPSSWHTVTVEEVNRPEFKVEKVYKVKSPLKRIELENIPELKYIVFSMICLSQYGSPNPERDPIISLSIVNDKGETVTFKYNGSDKELIENFIKYVNEYDPDIILSYGSNRIWWDYLLKRAQRHGLKLKIDRIGGEPHRSVYGHFSITGRANIDLFDFIEDLYEIKVKTLENVASYMGIEAPPETFAGDDRIYAIWTENPEKVHEICRNRAKVIMEIARNILDFAIQLSALVYMPLDVVGAAAVGFRVEYHLMKNAHKRGELIPKREERPYQPYKGGLVLEPKPGIHENIAVLDFASMYPHIMMKYNISPDTLTTEDEDVYVAPEVGYKFKKHPPGLYKETLERLLKARKEIKEKLSKLSPDDPMYRILDARQRAVKVIANANYGYAGWLGARWYVKEVAEATTAWGRSFISKTVEMAEKLGLTIIYGDTDSIFVKYDPEKVKELLKIVEEELGMEMKPDKIYERVLFTEAKKRYAGLLKDGRIDIVGLEVARGDWSQLAKKVQYEVIKILLREKSPTKALDCTVKYIQALRRKEVPLEDLVIWKTVTKDLEEYKARAPHVTAAKMLIEKGYRLTLGDKVGYVIVKGTGKLYERAVPYIFAKYDDIDIDYYIERQIVPAAARILKIFGIREQDILNAASGTSLMMFMKL
ncbi:DNA polymerase II [archaeon]|nr:MAG: DNA polymerase II [archaeon]RLG66207.1 MAG: DNA polymerase II [archaeon]RLG66258.1 MAG: DNA polymerase II [archaeon]